MHWFGLDVRSNLVMVWVSGVYGGLCWDFLACGPLQSGIVRIDVHKNYLDPVLHYEWSESQFLEHE